jgi:hypothetical protein
MSTPLTSTTNTPAPLTEGIKEEKGDVDMYVSSIPPPRDANEDGRRKEDKGRKMDGRKMKYPPQHTARASIITSQHQESVVVRSLLV